MKNGNHKSMIILSHKANDPIQHLKIKILDILDIIIDPQNNKHKIKNNNDKRISLYITYKHIKKEIINKI